MSTPQPAASYIEMIPPRVRGALYLSGFVLPLVVGYLVLRGWAGQPELWLASGWASLTNAIAGAQVAAGNVVKRRRPPPPPREETRDETGDAPLPEPRTAVVLAVILIIVVGVVAGLVLPR